MSGGNQQEGLDESFEAAAKALLEFFELGRKAISAASIPAGKYAPGVIRHLEEQTGQSRVRLFKARQFARLYTREQLEELCSRGAEVGLPVGIAHILELMQVKESAARRKLERETIKKKWSSVELHDERVRRFGIKSGRRNSGRMPKFPGNWETRTHRLEQEVSNWLRWLHGARESILGDKGDCIGQRAPLQQHGELSQDKKRQMKALNRCISEAEQSLTALKDCLLKFQ